MLARPFTLSVLATTLSPCAPHFPAPLARGYTAGRYALGREQGEEALRLRGHAEGVTSLTSTVRPRKATLQYQFHSTPTRGDSDWETRRHLRAPLHSLRLVRCRCEPTPSPRAFEADLPVGLELREGSRVENTRLGLSLAKRMSREALGVDALDSEPFQLAGKDVESRPSSFQRRPAAALILPTVAQAHGRHRAISFTYTPRGRGPLAPSTA